MIWPLLLTNLPCPCLELTSNELSGWIFCCVRSAISNPFPTALKTRDAFQVWPVHVTGYTPHRPRSFTLEIPGALPALRRGIRSGSPPVQRCCPGLGSRRQTPKHRIKQAPQKSFGEKQWGHKSACAQTCCDSPCALSSLVVPTGQREKCWDPQVCQALWQISV